MNFAEIVNHPGVLPLAVIRFLEDGTGEALYTEEIDLQQLGLLEVTRATEIEFNNSIQRWEVFDYTGQVVFSASSRQRCLEWEHEFFTKDESEDHNNHELKTKPETEI